MPGHPSESPPAPEELKRLAWQTDQMRRRSEEDQVRVADWAAFSQYVKRHYHKFGIYAKPWRGSVGPPVPRPPEMPPRAFPQWIAEVVSQEAMLPYVDREYPFREALELSGLSCRAPLTPRSGLPEGPVSSWGQADVTSFKSGGSSVMVGDRTLYDALKAASSDQHRVADESSVQKMAENDGKKSALPVSSLPPQASRVERSEGERSIFPALSHGSFREWLELMDDSQFIIQYHDRIAAQFDSLSQIIDLYVRAGELDDQFFHVVGITKLGHRRLFQKWFRENCHRHEDASHD